MIPNIQLKPFACAIASALRGEKPSHTSLEDLILQAVLTVFPDCNATELYALQMVKVLPAPSIPNPPAPPAAPRVQVGGDHYQTPIQHAEFCQRNQLTWCEASATKYLCRHRKKNKLQDALKALHYTLMMLDFEYPKWREDPDAVKLVALCNSKSP